MKWPGLFEMALCRQSSQKSTLVLLTPKVTTENDSTVKELIKKVFSLYGRLNDVSYSKFSKPRNKPKFCSMSNS